MILRPNKCEVDSERQNRITENIDKMVKPIVLAVIATGAVAAIGAAIFGHNWNPSQ